MYDIGHLRHFLAVMDHGSLSEAAKRSFVTQPALSKSIQRLEASLGHPLFDRAGSLRPTALALHLVPLCRRTVQEYNDIIRETELFMSSELGELRIGAGPFFAEILVIPAIKALLSERPKTKLELEVHNYDLLPEKLRAREFDMFVADVSELRSETDLRIIPCPKIPVIWVCRKGHPLAQRKRLAARDMFEFHFVLPRPAPWGLDWLDQNVPVQFRGKKKGEDFVALFSNHLSSLRDVVLSTDAITAMAPSMLEPNWRQELFHVLPIKGPPPYSDSGIVMLKDRSMPPIASFMLRMMREHFNSVQSFLPPHGMSAAGSKPGRTGT